MAENCEGLTRLGTHRGIPYKVYWRKCQGLWACHYNAYFPVGKHGSVKLCDKRDTTVAADAERLIREHIDATI